MPRIVWLEPTWSIKFCSAFLIYYRKINQHCETMGYYDRKDTIFIVDQYSWWKNSLLIVHEFIHFLNDRVTNILFYVCAWVFKKIRGVK